MLQGPGCADHNTFERVANVLTSIPYVAVGIHSYRTRKTEAGKLWGASIAGVGIASGIYHGTTGRCKSFGRKLDYWTIAYSSNLLAKAAFPGVPPAVSTQQGVSVRLSQPHRALCVCAGVCLQQGAAHTLTHTHIPRHQLACHRW